jgi:hypothetical protein
MKKTISVLKLAINIMLVAILFQSCGNDDSSSGIGDSTPEDLMSVFDEFEVVDVDREDVIGMNGVSIADFDSYLIQKYGSLKATISLSPNDQLIALRNSIVDNQLPFTNKQNYLNKFPNQPNGLAYINGGVIDEIQKPVNPSKCQEHLAGFDCSGLLFKGVEKSGVNIKRTVAAEQAKPGN